MTEKFIGHYFKTNETDSKSGVGQVLSERGHQQKQHKSDNGASLLVLSGDVTVDGCSKMNSEV